MAVRYADKHMKGRAGHETKSRIVELTYISFLPCAAIGAAGVSGLAYGLSVICEKGSRGLKEIRSIGSEHLLKPQV